MWSCPNVAKDSSPTFIVEMYTDVSILTWENSFFWTVTFNLDQFMTQFIAEFHKLLQCFKGKAEPT